MLERRNTQRRTTERREQNMWVLSDRRSGLDRRAIERRNDDDRRLLGDRRRAERG